AALEAAMAAKAASRASPTDRQRLIAQRAKLEATKDIPAEYVREDIALHHLIMEISGDVLSSAIIRTIHTQAREASKYHGQPTQVLMSETHDAHLKIIDTILGGDSESAFATMREHIESAWKKRRQE